MAEDIEKIMIVVDGVRYRAEDAKALGVVAKSKAAKAKAPIIEDDAEFVEGAPGEDPDAATVDAVEAFDPRKHNVEEVLAELHRVAGDIDEVARIKELEDAGKGRVTITEWEPAS